MIIFASLVSKVELTSLVPITALSSTLVVTHGSRDIVCVPWFWLHGLYYKGVD